MAHYIGSSFEAGAIQLSYALLGNSCYL